MTKSLTIDPNVMRAPGSVKINEIPMNTYQKTVKDEKDSFTKEEFLNIYRDMWVVREFETMLNQFKITGQYEGVEYTYPGPAHLGIGQEAAYVGQAFVLDNEDFIFGSHRSHGEILAKGMSAIEKLSEEELLDIMKSFFDGETYKVVEKHTKYEKVKDRAREFLIYGMIAEIWGRETGFNKGLGGSMHAFFTPFGVYPNNAIVGGSGPISTGAALYKRVNQKPGMVVCNIGDGSLGCGPVYESMNFAAMDQYNTLWDDTHKGGLPIIYNIWNNSYGMGGQTGGETMGFREVARLAAGINPDAMHAERIDGYNPLAVIDAYRRKKKIIEERRGPVLLDVVTYRTSGHSPSDSSSYRSKEEIAMWEEADSIKTFGEQLLEAGVATAQELKELELQVKTDMLWAVRLGKDEGVSPRIDLDKNPDTIADMMFTNLEIPSLDPAREPEVLTSKSDNSRVQKLAAKSRSAYDENGKAVSKNKMYQFRDAIFEAAIDKFYQDPTLIAYGEDNRDWGGAFGVYGGLTESLPYHRLFNTPISEAAIVGTSVGYAMAGGRVMSELMYIDFLGRAGDEVFNQMSKWQSMSGDVLKMPFVLRVSVGSKYGAQHSQDWSALCTHIPGLKVVFPATPYDAKGLLNAALNGSDPVIFLESQRLYDIGEQFQTQVPEGYYEVKIGEPDIKREGSDLTVLSIGATLYRAVEAADILQEKYGISTEIIDARSLVPFNYEKVLASVKKTGKIIITGDACERGSHLKEFAQTITELAFDDLDAPPVVVGAKNWITPAHELEHHFFPQASWIIDAFHSRIMPLPNHTCTTNQTELAQIENNKRGV
ncbi:MAG TPA: thiamine pyrophosphate-dependent enzyme [Anaerovoracaceae bacterium]|nr:thiamine pyrophosphate-dependent enzyme [Anaerovoracaceae bacterium]